MKPDVGTFISKHVSENQERPHFCFNIPQDPSRVLIMGYGKNGNGTNGDGNNGYGKNGNGNNGNMQNMEEMAILFYKI